MILTRLLAIPALLTLAVGCALGPHTYDVPDRDAQASLVQSNIHEVSELLNLATSEGDGATADGAEIRLSQVIAEVRAMQGGDTAELADVLTGHHAALVSALNSGPDWESVDQVAWDLGRLSAKIEPVKPLREG